MARIIARKIRAAGYMDPFYRKTKPATPSKLDTTTDGWTKRNDRERCYPAGSVHCILITKTLSFALQTATGVI